MLITYKGINYEVEIRYTSFGTKPSFDDPGEDPEFDIIGMWQDGEEVEIIEEIRDLVEKAIYKYQSR